MLVCTLECGVCVIFGAVMLAAELQKASPHDILRAWQDGAIGYRDAMRLTACENLFELCQACRSGGVTIRGDLTAEEMRAVEIIVLDLNSPRPAA
jgi:hypothetical protein